MGSLKWTKKKIAAVVTAAALLLGTAGAILTDGSEDVPPDNTSFNCEDQPILCKLLDVLPVLIPILISEDGGQTEPKPSTNDDFGSAGAPPTD